ncbi:MAG: HAD family phosphatase [Patescibacteria group bacterium]
MIKAAIYDLDDLMVNSLPLHRRAWDILFNEYQVKTADLPPNLSSRFVGMRISDILKEMINHFKLKADYQILYQKRQEIFLKLAAAELEMLPGLIESLNFFRDNKIKIALATSGTKRYINFVLNKFNLNDFFDIIITGDDVKLGKPNAETYQVTCQKLNLDPKDCVVLEDATSGIMAAKAANCKCIAIKNPHTPPQILDQSDLILNSLAEIDLNVLNSL